MNAKPAARRASMFLKQGEGAERDDGQSPGPGSRFQVPCSRIPAPRSLDGIVRITLTSGATGVAPLRGCSAITPSDPSAQAPRRRISSCDDVRIVCAHPCSWRFLHFVQDRLFASHPATHAAQDNNALRSSPHRRRPWRRIPTQDDDSGRRGMPRTAHRAPRSSGSPLPDPQALTPAS